jgi:hypothetical protein
MMAGAAWAPQSLNRFRYANNDPIDLIDPFGLDAIQFCWTHIERTDLNLGGTKVKGHERLITDRCEWLTFDFGNTPGDNWTVRLFGRSTVCSAARAKTNTMGIRVVRDNPHVKGEVTKVQGSAKANALKGEELTMGVTLLNDGSLIPQAASKDDPFGMSGPAPNVAYLQYGADAGATLNLNLTLTVQTINPLTGFNVDTPVSKDNISIDIRCFAKPDFTKE